MNRALEEPHRIVARDVEIFRTLEDFRAMALEQIWAVFFNGLKRDLLDHLFLARRGKTYGAMTWAYHRMQMLTKLGYLDRMSHWGIPHIYKLGERGFFHLRSLGKPTFAKAPQWPRKGEMEHALFLTAAGLVFSKVLGMQVLSERRLLSDFRKNTKTRYDSLRNPLPDMVLETGGGAYLFELELTEKSRQKYLEIWKSRGNCLRSPFPGCLYLARDQHLAERILSFAKKDYFPGIYACDLDTFRARGGQATWTNFKGRDFNLTLGRHAGPAGEP